MSGEQPEGAAVLPIRDGLELVADVLSHDARALMALAA